MPRNIDDLVSAVISKEGGYVNNPADKGGPTKYGITIKSLSAFLGRPATAADVMDITVDLAKEIYLANYYYGPRINTMSEQLQPTIFDMAVNSGPRNSVSVLQHVINKAGWGPLDVDGTIGPSTRQAANRCLAAMGAYMVNALVDERLNFINAILERDPTQRQFANGWKARAESFRVAV